MKKSHNYSVDYDGTDKGDDSHGLTSQPSVHDSGGGHQLAESVLDSHHDTLMKAEAIKGNPHIMKQLKPHIEKKMGVTQKILSIDQLKKVSKQKNLET